ncbi:MAG: cell wall-active antibiotics response protein LiaF [Candidatus Zixiibacteriota bacterium]
MTSSRIWGLILVIAGSLFLLNNLNFEIFEFVTFWSLALICFGIYLVYRAIKKERGKDSNYSDFKFFGDTHHDNISGDIDKSDISHFIGDTDLNFVNAELKPGVNRLNISSFIGDIRIFVKKDTAVKVYSSNLIGDLRFFDVHRTGFGNSFSEQTPNYESASTKIDIHCSSLIGDVKISAV